MVKKKKEGEEGILTMKPIEMHCARHLPHFTTDTHALLASETRSALLACLNRSPLGRCAEGVEEGPDVLLFQLCFCIFSPLGIAVTWIGLRPMIDPKMGQGLRPSRSPFLAHVASPFWVFLMVGSCPPPAGPGTQPAVSTGSAFTRGLLLPL